MRYENVDFEKGCIFIEEAAKRVYEDQEFEGEETKNVGDPKTLSSIRVIPIHKSLLDMLAGMRANNPNAKLVFADKNGKMRSYHSLRWNMYNFWNDHGLGEEKITFHRFRHCYCSYMATAKVPTEVRAALMGHLNDNVTDDVYTDVEDPSKRDAVEKYFLHMKSVFEAV